MPTKKAHLNLAIDHVLKAKMQAIADIEKRSLGNLGELLVAWGFEQLLRVGCSTAMLKGSLPATDQQIKTMIQLDNGAWIISNVEVPERNGQSGADRKRGPKAS